MKQFFIVAFMLLVPYWGNAQYDSTYRTRFYEQRVSFFEAMPDTPNEIIMLGNSLTNGVSWSEIFQNANIKNRGISGDNTFGVLARLDEIIASKPDKVFILIGLNDLSNNVPVEVVTKNYERIITTLQQKTPQTRLYLQTLFPTNNQFSQFPKAQNKDAQIKQLNDNILQLSKKFNTGFIDLHPLLLDSEGRLDKCYTNDGLHLLGNAYLIWAKALLPYINEVKR